MSGSAEDEMAKGLRCIAAAIALSAGVALAALTVLILALMGKI